MKLRGGQTPRVAPSSERLCSYNYINRPYGLSVSYPSLDRDIYQSICIHHLLKTRPVDPSSLAGSLFVDHRRSPSRLLLYIFFLPDTLEIRKDVVRTKTGRDNEENTLPPPKRTKKRSKIPHNRKRSVRVPYPAQWRTLGSHKRISFIHTSRFYTRDTYTERRNSTRKRPETCRGRSAD